MQGACELPFRGVGQPTSDWEKDAVRESNQGLVKTESVIKATAWRSGQDTGGCIVGVQHLRECMRTCRRQGESSHFLASSGLEWAGARSG